MTCAPWHDEKGPMTVEEAFLALRTVIAGDRSREAIYAADDALALVRSEYEAAEARAERAEKELEEAQAVHQRFAMEAWYDVVEVRATRDTYKRLLREAMDYIEPGCDDPGCAKHEDARLLFTDIAAALGVSETTKEAE